LAEESKASDEGKASEEAKETKPAKEESKEPEHWQEEKFDYKSDFGEGLVGKKQPSIFVFDLEKNTLEQVQGIRKDVFPARPIFDEHSKGIVFSGVRLEFKKLGLTFCLNRPTALCYI
jgi:hypothetical protein